MNSSAVRSIDVDFLRGIALLIIAIDHVSLSVLSHLTIHSFAWCDAAEVFVFLGGYASAAGYCNLAMRHGEAAARERFMRRTWDIYRAYWATAALMLASGAALALLPVTSPLTEGTDWPSFAAHPWHMLIDVSLLRVQPYLSAVLPMYMLFALTVPFSVPFAQRAPIATFAASLAVWSAAPWLARMLPMADSAGWSFDPFAWQLIFMLGVLCRLHPVSASVQTSSLGKWLTAFAGIVALVLAVLKLGDPHTPGYMKQNLASVRVVSFLALAWLCANAVRLGWIRTLAGWMPGVVRVGQQGLVCFVGGSVISIVIDTALRLAQAQGYLQNGIVSWLLRLSGDAAAIFALLLLARISREIKASHSSAAVATVANRVAHIKVDCPETSPCTSGPLGVRNRKHGEMRA